MIAMNCPKCKSDKVVKRGITHTKERGKQQRMKCNGCNRTFMVDDGFWKMKNKDDIIAMCVDMYLSNLSSRKMRNQLYRHFGIKVSHVTILNWVRKYVLIAEKYVEQTKPELSGEIYADETEVNCENRNDIFWCSVDWQTRFINATMYSPRSQNMEDAIEFMRKIKATGKPKYIQTDGLPFYPRAFTRAFYSNVKGQFTTEHRINNYTRTRKHNVRIETVFSKVKDRVNDFRGFKALWSAPILMAGIVIQHNYIEKHNTTGKVPCELAGFKLNLGQNRWMDLIRLSATTHN